MVRIIIRSVRIFWGDLRHDHCLKTTNYLNDLRLHSRHLSCGNVKISSDLIFAAQNAS